MSTLVSARPVEQEYSIVEQELNDLEEKEWEVLFNVKNKRRRLEELRQEVIALYTLCSRDIPRWYLEPRPSL